MIYLIETGFKVNWPRHSNSSLRFTAVLLRRMSSEFCLVFHVGTTGKSKLMLTKRQGANFRALLCFTVNFMLQSGVMRVCSGRDLREESYHTQGLSQMLVPYLTAVASYFPQPLHVVRLLLTHLSDFCLKCKHWCLLFQIYCRMSRRKQDRQMLLAPGNPGSQNCTHSTLVWVNNINKHITLLPSTVTKQFSFHLYLILLNTWTKSLEKVLDGQPWKERC